MSTGDGFACGLLDTGEVVCWGWNHQGQTDAPAGSFRSVSAGNVHACAIADSGGVVCWGATPAEARVPAELR